MSKTRTSVVTTVGLAALAATLLSTIPASAGSQNLSCTGGGYKKVATYANSIKCRKIRFASSRREASTLYKVMLVTGHCNSHSGPVTARIFRVGSRYKVQAAFICANIS